MSESVTFDFLEYGIRRLYVQTLNTSSVFQSCGCEQGEFQCRLNMHNFKENLIHTKDTKSVLCIDVSLHCMRQIDNERGNFSSKFSYRKWISIYLYLDKTICLAIG